MAYSGPAEPLKPVLFPVKLGGDEIYYLSETELGLLREDPHLVLIEGESYPESVKPRMGPPLKPGYRVIPSFPDYCVNRKANVRHIQTGRSCWLEEVTKKNQAMIVVKRDGVNHYKSAQKLRDEAFPEGENR